MTRASKAPIVYASETRFTVKYIHGDPQYGNGAVGSDFYVGNGFAAIGSPEEFS
jgi:hypothetical protein